MTRMERIIADNENGSRGSKKGEEGQRRQEHFLPSLPLLVFLHPHQCAMRNMI
jgi:hypothetical protein